MTEGLRFARGSGTALDATSAGEPLTVKPPPSAPPIAASAGVLRVAASLALFPVTLPARLRRRHRLLQDRRRGRLPLVRCVVNRGDQLLLELHGGGSAVLRASDVRSVRWTVYEDRRHGFAPSTEVWTIEWLAADGTLTRVADVEPTPGEERPLDRVCTFLLERGKRNAPRWRDISSIGPADVLLLGLWTAACLLGGWFLSTTSVPGPWSAP